MDAALQQLLQRWRATDAIDDGVRAAQGRLRAGLLSTDDARLAATLGDPVALALGHEPLEVPPLDAALLSLRRRAGLPSAPRLEHVVSQAPAATLRALFADAALRHLGGCTDADHDAHGAVVRRLAGALRGRDEAALSAAAEGVTWQLGAGDWRDHITGGTLQPDGGRGAAVVAAAAANDAWARALQVALSATKLSAMRGPRAPGMEGVVAAIERALDTETAWLERRLAGLLVWGADGLPPPDRLLPGAPPPSPGAFTRAWRWLSGARRL